MMDLWHTDGMAIQNLGRSGVGSIVRLRCTRNPQQHPVVELAVTEHNAYFYGNLRPGQRVDRHYTICQFDVTGYHCDGQQFAAAVFTRTEETN